VRSLILASAALAVTAAHAAEPQHLACAEVAAEAVVDLLGRDGLSAVECPLPDGAGSVQIVSDENVSWPVLLGGPAPVSFEDALLERVADFGGSFHFRPAEDAVRLQLGPPRMLFVRFAVSDPVTLEPGARWVAVALDPVVIGIAETPDAAASPQP
jgi:hypothetical protein